MNHIYRLIWNDLLQSWVAVAEFVRGRGKRSDGVLLIAATILSSPVQALDGNVLPTGGTIVAGSGTIAQNGNRLTVTQGSDKLVTNWQDFSIGSGNTVNFVQPSSSAVALNRVLGSDASQIYGTLTANGKVFLINPNGVLFGKGAQVDVGGLVASTLNIKDSDFLAGNYVFSGEGGGVSNSGTLRARDGGAIALLGGKVSNDGVIEARLGSVAMAAGGQITLDFAGDGLLNVKVDKAALDALVENHGAIRANGGSVLLTADAGEALLQTVVNNTGLIEARTLENRAGRIVLLGGFDGGAVNVAGTLDASAPSAGNGGFIETSGAHVKVADSAVITTKASNGSNGKWLIDPVDFTVAASGGDMTGTALSNALANGAVEIQSTSGSSGVNGDVNIKDVVSWSRNTLTLNAQHDINIYSQMDASGTAGLFFKFNQADAGGNYYVYAPVNLASTGSFQTQSGSAGAVSNWTILTSLGAEGSTTGTDLQGINGNLSGNYVLGADIDASVAATWNGGKGFRPLGDRYISSDGFTGNFDGLGHVIDGLTIINPDTRYSDSGLFEAASNATFANVGLTNVSIHGSTTAGGLVNRSGYVTIRNSYVTGSISAFAAAGGVLGWDIFPRGSSSLINVYASADVTATSVGVGGALLTGIAGGLVGGNVNLVENSYSTGKVTGGNYVGGLVGYANEATIKNSYFGGTIAVNGTPYTTGAILGGRLSEAASLYNTLTNVYWNTDLTGTSLTANGNAGLAVLTNATGLTTAQMRNAANWTGFNFTSAPGGSGWVLLDGVMPLLASEWSSTIRNAHQLQLMGLNLSASYALANNIDASATNGAAGDVWYDGSFSPVGNAANKFTGSFDGQNHVISHLTIDRATQDYIGLFGYADAATLWNVILADADIMGRDSVGTLLGRGTGANLIDNAASSGTVASSGTSTLTGGTGGLLGWVGGTVSNSHSSATVEGYAAVGGLVGRLSGSATENNRITRSWASGDVTASFGAGGGLAGLTIGRLDHVYATSNVSGGQRLGGLVGEVHRSDYWTNADLPSLVNVTYATGNVVGSGDRVGGLVGNLTGVVEIANSFATGNVEGHNAVGGLVGYISPAGNGNTAPSINASYTLGGTVTGNDYVGGLVGEIEGYTDITRSYVASGALTGTGANAKVGGVVGYQLSHTNDLIDMYAVVWNTETTGTTHMSGEDFFSSGYVVGATTAQMKTMAPYNLAGFYGAGDNGYTILTDSTAAGRSFVENDEANGSLYNVFRLYEGNTYPLLMAFLTDLHVTATPVYDGTGTALANIGAVTLNTPPSGDHIYGTSSLTLTQGDTLTLSSTAAGQYTATSNATLSGDGLYSDQFGYNITYGGNTSRTIATNGSAAGDIRLPNAITWSSGTLVIDTHGAITTGASGVNSTAISGDAFRLVNGNWRQNSATLAGFTVNDFQLAGGTFLRATSGDGGSATPYLLSDVFGLQGMASAPLLGSSFALAGNVDAGGTAQWNGGAGFVPVGTTAAAFTGSLDGRNHTVSNLTINRGGQDNVGLLGYVQNASLRDIGLIDAAVTGRISVGGLVGWAGGTSIRNSFVAGGTVTAESANVGGLAGALNGTSLLDGSYASANVEARSNGGVTFGHAGGLVGVSNATISNSYATGNVTGSAASVAARNRIGGLVGIQGSGTISNSYATGTVSGDNTLGGLIGFRQGGTDSGSFYAATDASGNSINGGATFNALGTGKTLAQLRQLSTFTDAGWDIDAAGGTGKVWRIYGDATTPLLRGFLTALTVTADSGNKTYDGTAAGLGVSYSAMPAAGLLLGTATTTLSGKDAGSQTVRAGGLASTQRGYDIVYADGTVQVGKATLTVSGTSAANKTYDGTTTATLTAGTLSGFVGTETVTAMASGDFDGKNAGSRSATARYTLADGAGGGLAANYTLVDTSGHTATITPKTLAVSGTSAANKTYDGTTTATFTAGTLSGFVGTETVTATASGDFDSKNAGSRSATASYTLADGAGGGLAANYTLADTSGHAATITPKTLAVSGTSAANKTYDGTTTATLTAGTLSGFVGTETVTATASGDFDGKDAGSHTATAHYTLADGANGGQTGNYTLADTSGHAGSIAPAVLVIVANNAGRSFDGTAYGGGNGVSYNGFVAGENASHLAGSLSYAGNSQGAVKAGSYAITPQGLSSGNYVITYQDGTLTIRPAAPVVSNPAVFDLVPPAYRDVLAATQMLKEDRSQTVSNSGPTPYAIIGSGIRLPEGW